MAIKFSRHPGSGFIKVICDVCGGLFYRKDTVKITDKWNFQNGLVVCLKDADKINEQVLPNNIIDKPVPSPELIRKEHADEFVSNVNDDTLPTAPTNLYASPASIEPVVALSWQGPSSPGSSGIIGYKVRRILSSGEPIVSLILTGDEAPYYEDVSSSVSAAYSYEIAAINSFGTGPYSAIFYYPTLSQQGAIDYILVSQDASSLTTGSDLLFIL